MITDWLAEKVNLPAETRWQVEKTETGAIVTVAHPGGGKVSLDLDHGELKKLLVSLEQAHAKKTTSENVSFQAETAKARQQIHL
jgi:hypothetical protein